MTIRHWIASITAAGVLVGGGVTAAALVAPAAGAQDSIPGVEAQGSSADAHHPLRQTLDALVADGTLDQAQADTVYDALVARVKAARQQRAELRQQWAEAVAGAVGTTTDQLAADLRAGQSLAEIGAANGRSRQEVIDGLAAALKARLDQAVSGGHLTQDQADRVLQQVTGRLGTVIDQPHPHLAGRLRRLRHHLGIDGGAGGGAGDDTTTTTAG